MRETGRFADYATEWKNSLCAPTWMATADRAGNLILVRLDLDPDYPVVLNIVVNHRGNYLLYECKKSSATLLGWSKGLQARTNPVPLLFMFWINIERGFVSFVCFKDFWTLFEPAKKMPFNMAVVVGKLPE
ncbi:MAG: hypothetical protein IPP57_21115 [Candidatus Obscuribacter sp.]|nr:hypothetical protein [Candidatus Obscuribacter sp.]